MKLFKKISLWLLAILVILYIGLCGWFYFSQDKMLFKTVKHPSSYKYKFDDRFEERDIKMEDGLKLNGVLFKTDSSKGLILWLPGGRGLLDSIGRNASYYTSMQYDIFMLNYRGFGKSEGLIESEEQFYQDLQSVYTYFKKEYGEDRIIVFGYSLGSGPAAALASGNRPKMLVLQAPYYSMEEMTQGIFPYLPTGLFLKYKFKTYEFIQKTKSPIVIIHGADDDKIKVDASLRMKKFLKKSDKLIILKGQDHQNFIKNEEYLSELKRVLNCSQP